MAYPGPRKVKPVTVVVVGQIARDLVLRIGEFPRAGSSAPVSARREMLGGKGANQAVGLAQLGVPVSLVGVVGDDHTGEQLLAQAKSDHVDVSQAVRRSGWETALIVDVVDDHGQWRYLEDVPRDLLVTERDVFAASEQIYAARAVIVQSQQPPGAALEAARLARAANAKVILDGAPEPDVLRHADVLRADAREAELLSCRYPVRCGRRNCLAGVRLVAGRAGGVRTGEPVRHPRRVRVPAVVRG